MADYVFTAAVGAGNARINAQLTQLAPRGDVSTLELAVPAKLQEKLVRIPSSSLLEGHVVAQVDVNGGDQLVNIIFQVTQVVAKTAVAVSFVNLYRAQDHASCPLNLVFPVKENDFVFVFNSAGINDLVHGPVSDLFKCRNDDKTVLIPFSLHSALTRSTASVATSSGTKPTSATLAADIIRGTALQNLCMQNVAVTELYLPGDSVTFNSHAVSVVLGNIATNSPLLSSPLTRPHILEAVLGLSFGLHQHLPYPSASSTKKEEKISFLWASGFGEDPAEVLTNLIIANSVDVVFRLFDAISRHMDAGAINSPWYSTIAQGILKYYNKYSSKNFLSWSPAFNASIVQEFFAQVETLFKKPVPAPRPRAELERDFVSLVTNIFDHDTLSMRQREWVASFPAEGAAWTTLCVTNQAVMDALPAFGGISMIPSLTAGSEVQVSKKQKTKQTSKTSAKPKAIKKPVGGSAPVATVVPPPALPAAGANTRGNSAQNVCRYHVKHLFLGMGACTVVGCTFLHQDDVKDFTKSVMLKWLSSKLSGDSDYAKLEAAIKTLAR